MEYLKVYTLAKILMPLWCAVLLTASVIIITKVALSEKNLRRILRAFYCSKLAFMDMIRDREQRLKMKEAEASDFEADIARQLNEALQEKEDKINPDYYKKEGEPDCFAMIRVLAGDWGFFYGCLFNAIKYLYRRGNKDGNSCELDTEKALRYLDEADKQIGLHEKDADLISYLRDVAGGRDELTSESIGKRFGGLVNFDFTMEWKN